MAETLAVICDYDKYAEFLWDLTETKTIKEINSNTHEVWYQVNLKFVTIEYNLILTKSENKLEWKEVEGNSGPFSYNNGGWYLKEIDGKTHAKYVVNV